MNAMELPRLAGGAGAGWQSTRVAGQQVRRTLRLGHDDAGGISTGSKTINGNATSRSRDWLTSCSEPSRAWTPAFAGAQVIMPLLIRFCTARVVLRIGVDDL